MGAIDFVIVNPSTLEHVPPEGRARGAGDARLVGQAVIGLKSI